jgi:hypothetical protein
LRAFLIFLTTIAFNSEKSKFNEIILFQILQCSPYLNLLYIK